MRGVGPAAPRDQAAGHEGAAEQPERDAIARRGIVAEGDRHQDGELRGEPRGPPRGPEGETAAAGHEPRGRARAPGEVRLGHETGRGELPRWRRIDILALLAEVSAESKPLSPVDHRVPRRPEDAARDVTAVAAAVTTCAAFAPPTPRRAPPSPHAPRAPSRGRRSASSATSAPVDTSVPITRARAQAPGFVIAPGTNRTKTPPCGTISSRPTPARSRRSTAEPATRQGMTRSGSRAAKGIAPSVMKRDAQHGRRLAGVALLRVKRSWNSDRRQRQAQRRRHARRHHRRHRAIDLGGEQADGEGVGRLVDRPAHVERHHRPEQRRPAARRWSPCMPFSQPVSAS